VGLFAGEVWASPIQITVDTSSLFGTAANLAFDFIDGGPPSNSVTIFGFTSDGTLGDACITHDLVTCDPAPKLTDGTGIVTIDDSVFSFTEYRQTITLGNSLSFRFDTTGNPADTEAGSSPDGFSFSLLDQDAVFSLVPGVDALFLYSIGAPEPLQVFTQLVQASEVPTGAPEPGALALAMAGLLGLGLVRAANNKFTRHRLSA
jgi:hypothetical protein